jgi:serine/threonine protein kinase
VAHLGAQLADVLAYVHERGVVHGDIDARNVLVDAQGNGHLTGFGVDRGLGRPSGDVYALGMMLAGCLPYGLGPEWQAVLEYMTDENPDERPDAIRSGELLRNIESGSTSEFPLPIFATDDESYDESYDEQYEAYDEQDDEPPAERIAPPKPRMRPVAYTGLAGMGLAVTALAVVLATATGSPDQSTGEQRQPQVEQPSDGTHIQPPGQSYPQGPPEERGEARAPAQKPSRKADKTTTSPPSSSTTTSPTTSLPPQDGQDGEDPGNGNGNANGHRHRSLLDILLGIG